MICCNEINEYIKFVDEHPEEVDKDIKLLIKNVIIPTLESDNVFFDEETYRKCLKYCEKWYYELFPYQKFVYALFFMYEKDNRDVVIFSDILIFMGRGNGKDGMLMPLANFMQTPFYGVKNYHIEIIATAEQQAIDSFNVVYNMLEDNKNIMKKYFYWNKTEIIGKQTHSILEYNTSNAKTKDGKRPGMLIFNEKHAYEDYKQINVFTSALGKVKHSRTVTITTNGYVREGPLDEELAIAEGVLNGENNISGMLPILYRVDSKEEIDLPMQKFLETNDKADIDITVWCKANPSLRYLPILKNQIIQDYIKTVKQISYRAEFITKRMNIAERNEEETITSWENIKKASYLDVIKEIERPTGDLEGKSCIVGIDYASLNDFATAGLLFKKDGEYIWRCKTWICSKSKFFNDIKFPFKNKGQAGYKDFEVVNTESIDARELIIWVISQMSKYNVKKIILDTYRFQLLKQNFEEFGVSVETKDNPYGLIRMIRYPASIAAIVAPRIEVAFSEGNINIGNSAMMRWAINNTCVKNRKDGNKSYEKIEPKLRKNDPFMAFVCAISGQELLDEKVIYV